MDKKEDAMIKKPIMTTVALMLLTATVTYCITLFTAEREYNAKLDELYTLEQQYKKIDEVRSYIDRYYIGEYEAKDITDGALYGMVAMLGDQWSHYLNAEEFASVRNSLNSTVVGIGINATFDEENGALMILEVYEGSPAEYAKLAPFDKIISVDGNKVSDIGFDAAVKSISGEVDTPVSLVITREGVTDPISMSITRREIDIPQVSAKILDGNIGYIKITGFDSRTDRDFIQALDRLKNAGVCGVIFDVRNNPGGLMQVLVNMLDPLLGEGPILREQQKFGDEEVYTSDANELTLPMVVLTNKYSISAAEFFAAALQETGKATVVGAPTTGKGRAQSHIPLTDGSGLVLSISRYYTGSGVSLEETGGIKPDRVVELTEEEDKNFYLLSEEEDRQLQEAITVINEKNAPPPPEETPAEETPETVE